jgi:hypothetical protein
LRNITSFHVAHHREHRPGAELSVIHRQLEVVLPYPINP